MARVGASARARVCSQSLILRSLSALWILPIVSAFYWQSLAPAKEITNTILELQIEW